MSREPYTSCTVCTFGYCAPNRCYCGHEECNAYHSYLNPHEQPFRAEGLDASHHKKAWDNRKEDTWLDKL